MGASYEMTEILAPLAAFRKDLLVLSGLVANGARALALRGTAEQAAAAARLVGELDRPAR